MREDPHSDNFMALRLAAALVVIQGHSYPLTGVEGPPLLGNGAPTLAVKVFFVISGYLIAESWMRDPNVRRYLARRALRILPGLWGVVLLSVFVLGPIFTTLSLREYFSDIRTFQYLENIVLKPRYYLPGVFKDLPFPGAINGSLWTLPIEFFLYLALPLLLFPRSRALVAVVLALSAAASLWLNRIAYPQAAVPVWGTNLVTAVEMVPYFLSGSLYRLVAPKRFFNLQAAVAMVLILPLFATTWTRQEVVCLIMIPYAVLAFGFAAKPLFAGVARFGDVSYGVYLYGFVVQQSVAEVFQTDGRPLLNFCLSAPIAVALGFASWRLIERPALSWKPRTPSPVAAPAAAT